MASGITTDVVVIGSGITATAIGYALARRSLSCLLVLEQRAAATGATGRAFGVVRTYHADPVMISLARRSLRFYEYFQEETQRRVDFMRAGLLVLAPTGEQEALEKHVHEANKRGSDLQLLPTGAAVLAIESRLSLAGVGAAAYEPDALYGSPVQVSAEFVNAARLRGAKVREGIKVLRIDATGREGSRQITGVLTDGGYVKTRYVVNAGGSWVNDLNAMVGVHMPISPLRYVGLMLRHPVTFLGPPLPITFDLASGTVLRPNGPGQTLMGPLVAAAEDLVVPGADAPPADHAEDKEYLRFLGRRFPTLSTARISGVWSTAHDVSPDLRPIIGAVPGVNGYYCAVGMGGHSFCLAPAVGELVAREITESRNRPDTQSIRNAPPGPRNIPPGLRTPDMRSHAYSFRPERYPLHLPTDHHQTPGAADG